MASPTPDEQFSAALEAALQRGRELVERETTVSLPDVAFAARLDEQKARLDLERTQLENENERELIGLRKSYGRNMIRFLWAYFGIAVALVAADGWGWITLDESVVVALIGGTAVSVLGVVGTVVAGLFRVKSA